MKALVTGGLGFVGSNLAHLLLTKGFQVTVLDAMIEGMGANEYNVDDVKENISVVNADIRDKQAIEHAIQGVDYIFHLAGVVDHKRSMEFPYEDVDIRLNGLLHILESCKKYNPKAKMVFTSTRAVYGETKHNPVSEDAPTNPKGMYAITSLCAEKVLLMYHHVHGLNVSVARLSNVYGPRHQMKIASGIPNYFLSLALKNKPITVMGTGKVLRDFTYVDDVCEALLLCAEKDTTNGQVVNIGSETGTTFIELATEIQKLTGAAINMVEYPKDVKQIEPGDFTTDASKIKELTGWQATTPLSKGLSATVEFYNKHKEHYL